ncbi:MAG: hypothetical protein HZY79_08865 [Rhodoblastus sp.]|nr:MAG: hypothetical protein HZY79_08865 [Rhodoblastus sp.]
MRRTRPYGTRQTCRRRQEGQGRLRQRGCEGEKDARNDHSQIAGKIEIDAAAGRDFIAKAMKVVNAYIVEARREPTTPKADDTAAWVDRLGKAAAAFHAAYHAPLAPAAKSMVRADIERIMREARATPAIRLAEIASACQRISWAAKEAAEDVEADPVLEGGAAWRRFIIDLRKLCSAFGLRTGISSTGEDAAFVIFVAALLEKLPPEHRRGGSLDALAKAMQRAVERTVPAKA